MSEHGGIALATLQWGIALDTLKDAKILFTSGGSTPSVINRSYYAALYAVTSLFAFSGKSFREHRHLISTFDVEYVKSGKVEKFASKQFHWLFNKPLSWDYERFDVISTEIGPASIDAATDVMNAAYRQFPEKTGSVPPPSTGAQ